MKRRYILKATAVLAFFGLPTFANAQARGARQTRPRNQGAKPGGNRAAAALRAQSERFGGHLNTRHVGKSRAYLKSRQNAQARSVRSRSFGRTGPNSSAKQEKYVALQRANRSLRRQRNRKFSTFSNSAAAERAIAIATASNREKIRNFMNSNRKQITIAARSKSNLGTIYSGSDGKFRQSMKAKFVLRKAGSRYYIHTGHPI